MRKTANNNGVSVKAYAGTTGVILAMHIEPAKRAGWEVARDLGESKVREQDYVAAIAVLTPAVVELRRREAERQAQEELAVDRS